MSFARVLISAGSLTLAGFAIGYSGGEALQAGSVDKTMLTLFVLALVGAFYLAVKRVYA